MRGWDSTPRTLEFGSLSDELAPRAHYWFLDANGQWSSVNAQQLAEHGETSGRKRGVLEVLGQHLRL
eukprot:12329060-Alexandrium_andersonii.AAC.1